MSVLATSPYTTAIEEPLHVYEPEEKYGQRRDPGQPPAPERQPAPGTPQKPRLRDQLIEALRVRHYSPRTREAYLHWNGRFVRFQGSRPPARLGKPEVEQFLTHLAVDRKVSASTQNQALAAILFLYKHVLGRELEWLDNVVRAKRPERLPVVLTRQEVEALLVILDGVPWLMAMLLYETGLRLMECFCLRVKDIDFTRHEVLVRQGKGNKDRVTMLSTAAAPKLQAHLQGVRELHDADLAAGFGRVSLPEALARKYPNADREFG